MSEREKIRMSADEVDAFLGTHNKMQLATLNRDGSIHLVTMYYAVVGGRVAFWTYRSSQKALNMLRDPRVTCLVETGNEYFDLMGVQIRGSVEISDDPAVVLEVGRHIGGGMAGMPAEGLEDYIAYTARKRLAYFVQAGRISSWDHRKLLT